MAYRNADMAKIISFSERLRSYISTHPYQATIIALAVLAGGYYSYTILFASSSETRYVLATVERSTIVASVTGSGQITAESQLEIKPKVSGEITSVAVNAGDHVSAGDVIARIDAADALKNVRDARANLESAQIAYDKLVKPASELTVTQAQHNADNAKTNLAKAYADAYDDVVSTFLDLPSILTSLKDVTTGTTASRGTQWNIDYYANATQNWDDKATLYRDDASATFTQAQSTYDAGFIAYQHTTQASTPDTIAAITETAYSTAQAVSNALHSANTLLQFYEDQITAHNQTPSATAEAGLATLSSSISKMNTHLSDLRTDLTTISTSIQKVTETQQSLAEIRAGAEDLDIRSAQLSLTQRQNALQDAEQTLADYTVRAPFSGTIAAINVKKYDTAGSSAIATLVTPQQVASLSLNEVDATRVTAGQKATLTFDAIEDLTLTGRVASVDTVGTVSQGVVSYTVKIALDSQDSRVKPGMTVNASIITDVHADVLVVSAAAIKTQNGRSTVSVFTPAIDIAATTSSAGVSTDATPTAVPVELGITDDTNVEIVSGLEEGMQYVARTITATKTTTTSTGGSNRNGGLGGPQMF